MQLCFYTLNNLQQMWVGVVFVKMCVSTKNLFLLYFFLANFDLLNLDMRPRNLERLLVCLVAI